ncbi:hypothetical protein AC579_8803 [Pseudocercospora musae]|uniref:Uncharacterized protein n=1 Tax=Pseudocercospora musae TaxID=113226 RepID=A0A139HAB8_9PEZI|nr:hypothetical protein AC579_8803 [Pseudocercospora musae]
MKFYQALPAFVTIALAVEPYYGVTYGGNSRGVVNYTYGNLPYRNATEYPLMYQTFNWSYAGPAVDNGAWTVRYNTADNWLPGNLSSPGAEKVVVTTYALIWEGHEVYNNLSAKIANDTDALAAAGRYQEAPNMCMGFMGYDADFPDSVKQNMDVHAQDPCVSLFGDECLTSLRQAFTSAFNDKTCNFNLASVSGGLPGCNNTWDKKEGFTFLSSCPSEGYTLERYLRTDWRKAIANGSQASNVSYPSPTNDSDISYQIQTHAVDDNSTYEKELMRTQFLVFKESGKEAQLQCARFEASAMRTAAGTCSLVTAVLMVFLLLELV